MNISILDSINLLKLKSLFPELDSKQFKILLLWSYGIKTDLIASQEECSRANIKRILQTIKSSLQQEKLENVKQIFLIRILLYSISKSKI